MRQFKGHTGPCMVSNVCPNNKTIRTCREVLERSPVSHITYTVLEGTLNTAQSNPILKEVKKLMDRGPHLRSNHEADIFLTLK